MVLKNKLQHFDYIGDAELEAIVWSVRDALESTQDTVSAVLVATDSLCAKGWVKRMYSERPAAQKLLMELDELLKQNKNGKAIRISCIYVHTTNNIADIPSRTVFTSNSINSILCGDEDNWKSLEVEEVSRRSRASHMLLKHLLNGVSREGVMQGRQAIRQPHHESQLLLMNKKASQKNSTLN